LEGGTASVDLHTWLAHRVGPRIPTRGKGVEDGDDRDVPLARLGELNRVFCGAGCELNLPTP
jgi:hypothetical protein